MRYARFPRAIAKSPFIPLQTHASITVKEALLLREILKAYGEGDEGSVRRITEQISKLEYEADKVKQEARERIPSSIILPVDRGDLQEFLRTQDVIADKIQDVARLMCFRLYDLPKDVREQMLTIVDRTIDVVEEYKKAVTKIGGLLATSFRRKEVKEAIGLIPPIERTEHEIDILEGQLSKRLFQLEARIGPLGVYHVLRIVKCLAEVSDAASRAGDRLRTMVSK